MTEKNPGLPKGGRNFTRKDPVNLEREGLGGEKVRKIKRRRPELPITERNSGINQEG